MELLYTFALRMYNYVYNPTSISLLAGFVAITNDCIAWY